MFGGVNESSPIYPRCTLPKLGYDIDTLKIPLPQNGCKDLPLFRSLSQADRAIVLSARFSGRNGQSSCWLLLSGGWVTSLRMELVGQAAHAASGSSSTSTAARSVVRERARHTPTRSPPVPKVPRSSIASTDRKMSFCLRTITDKEVSIAPVASRKPAATNALPRRAASAHATAVDVLQPEGRS